MLAILLLNLWTIGASEEIPNCLYCVDYHRLCPAVRDPKYLENFLAKLSASDAAQLAEENTTVKDVNCSNPEYLLRCPLSCGSCTPCSDWMKAKLIPIQSVSAPFGKHQLYAVAEAAVDGDDTQRNTECFASGKAATSESKFTANIPLSRVDSIGFMGNSWVDLMFKVCLGDEQCHSCETIPDDTFVNNHSKWLKVKCPEGTKGNRVSIHQQADLKKDVLICEMNVTGIEL